MIVHGESIATSTPLGIWHFAVRSLVSRIPVLPLAQYGQPTPGPGQGEDDVASRCPHGRGCPCHCRGEVDGLTRTDSAQRVQERGHRCRRAGLGDHIAQLAVAGGIGGGRPDRPASMVTGDAAADRLSTVQLATPLTNKIVLVPPTHTVRSAADDSNVTSPVGVAPPGVTEATVVVKVTG